MRESVAPHPRQPPPCNMRSHTSPDEPPLPMYDGCGATVLLLLFIGLLGCCNEGQIPSHVNQLSSSKARDRTDAALQLARCGADAGQAVPRLTELMYDENVGVQSAAAYALRKIGTEDAKRALERATARKSQQKNR